jgi:hypothetical protein
MPAVGDLASACWIGPAGLLLLVAAAAGDPLGEGVERLLICHGWAGAFRFSPSALA